MTKKNASMTSLILLAVYCVFGFMPCIIDRKYWKADTPGVGIYTGSWSDTQNIFAEPVCFWAIVLLALAVVGIVAMALNFGGKQNTFTKYATLAPTAMIPVVIILAIAAINATVPNGEPAGTATFGYYGHFAFGLAWGFYIVAALAIAAGVLGLLIYLGKVEDKTPKETTTAAQQIIQLKELLDAGAITQEEFDAKKKQLLEM